jgi:hypothetical protein
MFTTPTVSGKIASTAMLPPRDRISSAATTNSSKCCRMLA